MRIQRNALFRYLTIKKKKLHKILLSKRFNKSNNLIHTISNCIYYLFQWRFNGIFPCHNQVKSLPPTLLYSSTRHQKKKKKKNRSTKRYSFVSTTSLCSLVANLQMLRILSKVWIAETTMSSPYAPRGARSADLNARRDFCQDTSACAKNFAIHEYTDACDCTSFLST